MECVCVAAAALFGECAAPEDVKFITAEGGDCFSVGIDEAGAVFGWGSGFYGELTEQLVKAQTDNARVSSSSSDITPATAAAIPPSVAHARVLVSPTRLVVPERCTRVSCGTNHVLAVSQYGSLYAWGCNRHHQVSPHALEVVAKPSLVEFPEPVSVTEVAGGGMHSLAVGSEGRVWSWGDNTHGQLGIGSKAEVDLTSAILVDWPPHRKVSSIAAGWAHSALLVATGELFTFGWGLYHQLGHGSTQNQLEPRSVDALTGLDATCGGPIVQVACGNWHTAARTATGDIYTWGWGQDGQLGHDSAVTSEALPRVVAADEYFDSDDPGHQAIDLACGSRHTLVLCANGDLHWWGRAQQRPPSRDAWGALSANQTCKHVAMGHTHALLLVEA